MTKLKQDISKYLYEYEHPTRVALSRRFPKLKRPIIFVRQGLRSTQNILNRDIKVKKRKTYLPHIIARHQSVLRRKLGDSDARLQEQKIVNLRKAISKLDGVIILPGKIFSFWNTIGRPTYKDGYVDGMLLSNGTVIEGIGGGLCQLSNFLYWIFLHAPMKTIERHHHSLDVFPDSGRTLPFGSGATVMYNFVDIKMRNVSDHPLQLKLWLTEDHLKGQILSDAMILEKFHVFEKNHVFIKRGDHYFRYNEIHRETLIEGEVTKSELVATNFAPVLYAVDETYIRKHGFKVLDFSRDL